MHEGLKRHAPVIITAVLVAGLVSSGPAVGRSVYDAMNADTVDGKHAVGANASPGHRAGKLVATDADTGRLPNGIIARAPNSKLLAGRSLGALGTNVLYADSFFTTADNLDGVCQTTSFTPKRKSYAVLHVDTFALEEGATTAYAVLPAFSKNGGNYHPGVGYPWTATTVATDEYEGLSNTGVVKLSAGSTYEFAILVDNNEEGDEASGLCHLVVDVYPRLPGSGVIAPPTPTRTGTPQSPFALR